MMRKYKLFVLVGILIICMVLTGCSFFTEKKNEQKLGEIPTGQQTEEINMRQTVLYYQDESGYLIPVMEKVAWEEGIGKAALLKMMSTEENIKFSREFGLIPVIPDGTEITLNIKDGLAKVNVNKTTLNCKDAVAESNMVSSIVNTLTEFPAVQKVQILLDGNSKKKLKYGTMIDKTFSKLDVNVETVADESIIKNASKIILYFENNGGNYLIPVTRLIENKATLDLAIQELLKGPREGAKLITNIPVGSKLLDVELKDGIATVNFSKEFNVLIQNQGNERMAIKSILLTCKQFPDVKEVKIKVEGKDYIPSDPTTMTIPTFANEY